MFLIRLMHIKSLKLEDDVSITNEKIQSLKKKKERMKILKDD